MESCFWRQSTRCFFLDGALTFYSGICLLYKQRGQTPPRPTRKRYCVGKCHHRRLFNLAQQKIQVTLFLVRDLASFNGKYKKSDSNERNLLTIDL